MQPPFTIYALPLRTPEGAFSAFYSEKGLCELDFPQLRRRPLASPARLPEPIAAWHKLTTRAVAAVLAGKPPRNLPPLDLGDGTEFQQQVWQALRTIPPGEVRTYGEVAQMISRPRAMRAVGGACGANPIPVLIPCHRVLAADRRIGGFSGGLHWKVRLLAREGVQARA